MINLVWISAGAFLPFPFVYWYWRHHGTKSYVWPLWLVAAMVAAVGPGLVCGFIALVVLPSRTVGKTTCRNFSKESGYATRFVIMNWADTGTCLALAPNGRWVNKDSIVINVPSRVKP